MGKWLNRWDEANQRRLEEDNRWLSGDDWADRSSELSRLRTIRSAVTNTSRYVLIAGVLIGVRIALVSGSWVIGAVLGTVSIVGLAWVWRRGGRWRQRYGHDADRIDKGPS